MRGLSFKNRLKISEETFFYEWVRDGMLQSEEVIGKKMAITSPGFES